MTVSEWRERCSNYTASLNTEVSANLSKSVFVHHEIHETLIMAKLIWLGHWVELVYLLSFGRKGVKETVSIFKIYRQISLIIIDFIKAMTKIHQEFYLISLSNLGHTTTPNLMMRAHYLKHILSYAHLSTYSVLLLPPIVDLYLYSRGTAV